MILSSVEIKDYNDIIKFCWAADPEIQKFSRNFECDLDERVKREIESSNSSVVFCKIYNGESFVGYFGTESKPFPFLTTIFIMPKYRNVKTEIWNYIINHLPETFYSGLFEVNTRAISFYKKMGGTVISNVIIENKPVIIFEFKRENLW